MKISNLMLPALLATAVAASAAAPHPRSLGGWYDDYANEDGMYNEGDPYGAWQDGCQPEPQDPFQVSSDWLLGPRRQVQLPPGIPPQPSRGSHPSNPGRKKP